MKITKSIKQDVVIEEIPSPINFSSIDGYGHANIERAFEILKGIDISSKDDLGGNLWGLDNINAPEVWTSSGCFLVVQVKMLL